MEVAIEKIKSRFTIKSKYNAELVQAIRKYDKKFWNQETLEWSLPCESFESFLKDCEQLGCKVNVKEHKPLAIITNANDNVELKFATFTNNFDQFKNIEQAVYDRDNRKLVFPKGKLNEVLELLKQNNMEHAVQESDVGKQDGELGKQDAETARSRKRLSKKFKFEENV